MSGFGGQPLLNGIIETIITSTLMSQFSWAAARCLAGNSMWQCGFGVHPSVFTHTLQKPEWVSKHFSSRQCSPLTTVIHLPEMPPVIQHRSFPTFGAKWEAVIFTFITLCDSFTEFVCFRAVVSNSFLSDVPTQHCQMSYCGLSALLWKHHVSDLLI